MADFVEVSIDSIRMSLTNQQRIIILKDKGQERYLPIWIGPYESESITIALQEIEISRPQTHDLVKNTISQMDGVIMRIVINELKDDIFFSYIEIERDQKKIQLDSRPSDALALAVRTHVPIYIAENVLQTASIAPVEEEYLSSESVSAENTERESQEFPQTSATILETNERLSVFEDFLNNIDQSQSPSDEDDDEDPIDNGLSAA